MDDALESDMKVFDAIKKYRLQSQKNAVNVLVDRLNLEPFLDFFTTFNTNNQLPYPNLYYAKCVFLNCYEGAWHTGINDEEIRGLCAGALLHDFNHSGGKLNDSENIKKALKGLNDAQAYAASNLLGLSKTSFSIANSVIKISQYQFENNPETFPEKIIRDAIQMQPYEVSLKVILKQYMRLKSENEMRQSRSDENHNFSNDLRQFLDNEVKWHTEWAANKAKIRNWEHAKSHLLSMITRQ